jgi:hypothetical protein
MSERAEILKGTNINFIRIVYTSNKQEQVLISNLIKINLLHLESVLESTTIVYAQNNG